MTTVAKIESNGVATFDKITFTNEQVELIRSQIAPEATPDELKLFVYQAQRTGLDPLARQIYCIHRKNGYNGKKMTIQTSIDGFRLVAERTGAYEGQSAPMWCDKDGNWKDVWPEPTPPAACKIGVWRTGFREPLYAIAVFDEYKQTTTDYNTRETKLSGMWAKMPALMLAKVAEALALRKAFPQDLSGLYTSDEMQQADAPRENLRDEPHLQRGAPLPQQPRQNNGGKTAAIASARQQLNGKKETTTDATAEVVSSHPMTKVELLGHADELDAAIMMLENLHTEEEIASHGKSVPEWIRQHGSFRNAASARMKEVKGAVADTMVTVDSRI